MDNDIKKMLYEIFGDSSMVKDANRILKEQEKVTEEYKSKSFTVSKEDKGVFAKLSDFKSGKALQLVFRVDNSEDLFNIAGRVIIEGAKKAGIGTLDFCAKSISTASASEFFAGLITGDTDKMAEALKSGLCEE